MGIFCEICLSKPADGKYIFHPGSLVFGEIRYYLDQEYEFTSITVSLKGVGKLYLEDRAAKTNFSNEERYVHIDSIIHTNEKKKTVAVGQYQTQFSFQLPYDIPSSLDHTKDTGRFFARCLIQYYVRIKFERTGRFNINKHYKKTLNVTSGQVPRMTTKPLIYGDQKSLLQPTTIFSSKKGFINLKATINNSVLKPGESVKVDYEIENTTNVDIQRVEARLLEFYIYTLFNKQKVKIPSEVEGTEFTYGAVRGGETAIFTAEIMIPYSCSSIDHSTIIAKDYSVLTFVVLPKPHINMPLEIPFQVIAKPSSSFEEPIASTSTSGYSNDSPPTYWEAMGEEKKSFDKDDVYVYSTEELKKGAEKS